MSSIKSILDTIMSVVEASRTPPPEIPAILILSGAKLRPGLSPILIASKIIERQTEVGASAGVLPSGGDNISESMELVRVEEIIKAIQEDARVDIAIAPGIPLTAQGANAGGPVVSIGMTTGIGAGNGIIR